MKLTGLNGWLALGSLLGTLTLAQATETWESEDLSEAFAAEVGICAPNTVSGNNYVSGCGNTVSGMGNVVVGHHNVVSGMNNHVYGSCQIVSGFGGHYHGNSCR